MAQRFSGKTILITGGNSGMGFATAKRIVQEGGRVVITGRDAEKLKQAQIELGPNADAIQADVSRLAEIEALLTSVQNKFGKLDGLFANAGVAKFQPISKVTESDFDSLFAINVKGVFFTLQKAIPLMNPGSSVLLNASVAASRGNPLSSVYGASKAAVRSMARTFSAAYIEKGIRFNTISPGPIETPIWDRSGGTAEQTQKTKESIEATNPMKRMGTVDEITSAITFLLSPESSYVLGVEWIVDGGMTQL